MLDQHHDGDNRRDDNGQKDADHDDDGNDRDGRNNEYQGNRNKSKKCDDSQNPGKSDHVVFSFLDFLRLKSEILAVSFPF